MPNPTLTPEDEEKTTDELFSSLIGMYDSKATGGGPAMTEPSLVVTLSDVSRRLGMRLSPVQEAYRHARRHGFTRHEARCSAIQQAPGLAAAQMQIVHNFVRNNAVWFIPDEAWPTEAKEA